MSSLAETTRTLLALARANAVYWPSVAPLARRRLRRCERCARQIPDRRLRSLALAKLRQERFNPLLAATLATLAPPGQRARVTEAIVALQVAYDYLDAVGERRLQAADRDDGGYATRLLARASEALDSLPAADAVRPVARAAAARCREAQRLSHEATVAGEAQLERWARAQAGGTDLEWPELLAGAQASVLCVHALIAAAADPGTDRLQAEALDALYLRIGALTMLDGLVDREEDLLRGERGFAARSGGVARLGGRLSNIADELAAMCRLAPHGSHHLMTATGVVAFYGTAPAAGEDWAKPAFAALRRRLGPALVAASALMRAWRAAARGTLSFRYVTHVAFVGVCLWG